MSQYAGLVKDLRETATFTQTNGTLSKRECALENLAYDAAAAIEALQAEVKRLEPKRGKWKTDPHGIRWCSLCDSYYQDVGYGFNYCPNCGAKMEVQDG